MTQWRMAIAQCPGVQTVSIAECENDECFDPLTGDLLNRHHFAVEKVLYEMDLLTNDGTTQRYDIPVACKCVAKRKKHTRETGTELGNILTTIARTTKKLCSCGNRRRRNSIFR